SFWKYFSACGVPRRRARAPAGLPRRPALRGRPGPRRLRAGDAPNSSDLKIRSSLTSLASFAVVRLISPRSESSALFAAARACLTIISAPVAAPLRPRFLLGMHCPPLHGRTHGKLLHGHCATWDPIAKWQLQTFAHTRRHLTTH